MECKKIKVLAIDDNQDNLITIKALIREAFPDAMVLTVTGGKEGIALARNEDPDVVLLDIVMPNMDGFSVCQAFKSDKMLRNIPVVFVTALKGDVENRIRAMEAGAEGFLNKPIDESELAVQIRAMVKIRAAHSWERDEKLRLEALVAERTSELRKELEERKKAEKQIVRNKEHLESLVAILQHETKSVQEFLDYTLAEAICLTESKIGYIYFYSEEKKEFTLNTWSDDVMKECSILSPHTVYQLEKTGFLGEAVRQRKSIVVNDFEADSPLKRGCPSGHFRLKKFLTVPVFHEKKIVAVVGVANKETDYDQSDVLQLTLLMDAVWKITSRKSTEEALQISEDRYRRITEGITDYLYTVRIENGKAIETTHSTTCEKVTGYTVGEFEADHYLWITMVPLEEREGVTARVKELLAGKQIAPIEHHICRKDGELRWVSDTAVLQKDVHGNLLSYEGVVKDITERRLAEKYLQESEIKYSSLFASMFEAVALHEIICDASGKPVDYRFVDVNPAFERLTGLKRTDVVGRTVLTVIPATEPVWIERYGKVALTGEPITFEDFSSELNKVYHIVAFSPQKNQFAVIFSDITERKTAEDALRESEEKQSAMISNISDVIGIIGADGNIKYKSSNIERWFGWDPQDVIGKSGWLTIHPDDVERVQNAFYILLEKDNSVSTIEYRYKCKNGSYKPVQLTATNLTKDPDICGVLMNYHDITRRKDAEDNLRTTEERFRTMFQQAPLGIALIDSNSGRIYEVNSRFAEITGRTKEEMIAIDWMSITHPDDIQEYLDNMARMNAQIIHGFTMKKRCVRPDGSYVWINMTIAPMTVEDKSKPSHLCMIQDITEMRDIEARLRQSEKMEAIGQLAGGIAHDFNNVLGGIIGYTDLSLDLVEKDSVMERNLCKILKASERAKNLVQQILTFSRQGSQQKSIIAVRPIVMEVLELFRATIPSSVIIESHLRKETKPILGDPTKIHEMLLNLATNGVYAMDRKGTLKVQLYPLTLDNEIYSRTGIISPGEYAVIEVTDTGHGMDANTLQKAFDPFFTTKPVGEGTGMGLSVVLGVVKLHDGDVQVDSEPGKGTTFKIYLPVTQEELKDDLINDDTSKFSGGKESVLFVDDEQPLVDIALDVLGSLGYKATGFSDSLEALKFVENMGNDIDILVTDQTMPGMTGVELAKSALKIRKDLPVILCTGYSVEINPERAAAIGISQMAMKPLRLRKFAEILRGVLDNSSKEVVHVANSGY